MAKRIPASASSCIVTPNGDVIRISKYTVGVGFEDYNDATPEELVYIKKRIRYNALMGQIQIYKQQGLDLIVEDKSLLVPPEPVGRFIPKEGTK